jgi:4-hydroxybenzoate polyprenyltransferase
MGAVLAAGLLPSPPLLLLGMIAVALAVSATHAFNDWVDRKRDVKVWANRPIPAGRMPASFAIAYATVLGAASLVITGAFFGMTAFFVLLIAEAAAIIYCTITRDAIGYMTLPPVIAMFPVGGWVAVSPETLFTSWLPWFLAAIVFTWQSAHIMVYMPAHPISTVNGRPRCEKKAFLFYPTPKQAAVLGAFFSAVLLAGILILGVVEKLGVIYWILAVPIAAVTFVSSIRLLASPSDKGRAIHAFNAASMALAFVCGGVCLDVMVRTYLDTFVGWCVQAVRDAAVWVESQSAGIDSFAYWAVLIVAAFVTLASVGKVLRELSQAKPVEPANSAGD